MRTLWAAAALVMPALLAPAFATAQGEPTEIARSEVQLIGPAELRALEDTRVSPIEVATWTSRTNVMVPVPLGRGALFVGANYTYLRTVVDAQGVPTERTSFHEVGLLLGGVAQVSERWSLGLAVAPSYASDFERRSADAINVAAVGRASVVLRPNELEVGFGVAASYRLGRLAPLPVFELRWVPRPEATLDIALPSGLRFSWIARERWLVAAGLRLDGSRYFIGNRDPLLPTTSSFQRGVVSVGLSVGARLSGPLWIELTGGTTLYRNFELLADSGDATGDVDVDNALFGQLAIVVRVGPGDVDESADDAVEEPLSAPDR